VPTFAVSFPTIEFTFFFVLTATISWLLRRHRTSQKVFLLVASYFFYAKWDLRLLSLLAGVSLVDWAFAEVLVRLRAPAARRAVAFLGITFNVGVLCVFKLYDFFRASVSSFAGFLGLSAHLPILEILLPVGISFYTFQGIAYLVDTYRGTAYRPRSLLDFLLFMAFFPKLLAGPICRSHELLPQIGGESPENVPDPSRAIALITTGLFKKMVLASLLATHLVDDAFGLPASYSSLELLIAVYAYTAQIYLDFSGYTDLARGLALLLGFEIPENFRYPYAATNIGEYWNRWHITFSTWLRDYIYFPLGGSRRSKSRTYLNLILTFLVCGIWHGSQWTYVIWGLAHGVGLAVFKLSLDLRRAWGLDPYRRRSWAWAVAGWFVTLNFCAFVRIPFKSADLEVTGEFFRGLAQLTARGHGIDPVVVGVTVLTIAMNFVGRPIFEAFVRGHARQPALARPLAWATIGLVMLTIKTRDVAPYIYFGF